MVFLNLRQRTDSVQALVTVTPENISKQMVKWTAGLADESIVLVQGVVKKTPEIIKSASVGDVEVHLSQVRVGYLSHRLNHLPVCTDPSHFWSGHQTAFLFR